MPALPVLSNSSSPGSTPMSATASTSSAVTRTNRVQSSALRVTMASRSIAAHANSPHVTTASTTNSTRSVTYVPPEGGCGCCGA